MFLIPIVVIWWAREPMRFAVGRSRCVLCVVAMGAVLITAAHTTLADDRYARDDGKTSQPDPTRSADIQVQTAPKILREGTMIPPTSGKITMLGRRWMFTVSRADDIEAESFTSNDSERLKSRRMLGPISLVATGLPKAAASEMPTQADGGRMVSEVTPASQYPLTENLNLQRIVEAMRADPADDRWILTGEISEFFDENRLTIRTAQRSNRK